jgi:isoleucyl-tRNA synthetase
MPGDRESSVFLAEWYSLPRLRSDEAINQQDWAAILQAKEAINKVIEDQRNQGVVKGSLGADIQLFANPELHQSLSKLGDELRFVTITSKATLLPLADGADANDSMLEGLKVGLERSSAEKCVRCWHFIADVGTNAEHPEICGRCISNLSEVGEIRHYA